MVSTPTTVFLAGIFPGQRDRLLRVISTVKPEMMADEHSRFLYASAVQFLDKYGDVPSHQVVQQLVSHERDAGEAAALWQHYSSIVSTPVSDAEFAHAVDTLLDTASRNATGEALAVAFEILESGYTFGNDTVQGHDAAREFLASRMTEIAQTGIAGGMAEVDVREDVLNVWKDYHERKNAPTEPGIQFGIPALDEHTGGIQKGELVLVAAYTNQGKSMMCVNTAWSAAVEQGRNVFYSTSETARNDITNRFIARHSRLPQFGMPEGLDSSKIRRSTLNPAEEKVFGAVLEDLRSNPNYGRFHVSQIPRGATLNYVEQRMLQKHHEWGIDFAVNDYLNLLRPEKSRGTQREEASDILKDAKVLATSFAGIGVPFMSPWQINRNGFEAAKVSQVYDMLALSEASEAEKSSDLVLTLLHNSLMDAKRTLLQLLKSRNGAPMNKVELAVDYRNAYFNSIGTGGSGGGSILQGGGFGR